MIDYFQPLKVVPNKLHDKYVVSDKKFNRTDF